MTSYRVGGYACPEGVHSLSPLSGAGLCEAVTTTPASAERAGIARATVGVAARPTSVNVGTGLSESRDERVTERLPGPSGVATHDNSVRFGADRAPDIERHRRGDALADATTDAASSEHVRSLSLVGLVTTAP